MEKTEKNQSYFVLDATCLPKREQKIEEVAHVYDPGRGKYVPGFEVLTLLLVNFQSCYPLDFGHHCAKLKPHNPNGLPSFLLTSH